VLIISFERIESENDGLYIIQKNINLKDINDKLIKKKSLLIHPCYELIRYYILLIFFNIVNNFKNNFFY